MKKIALILALFTCLISCKKEETKQVPTLKFSAIPDQDSSALDKRFKSMAEYLSQKLEVPVEYLPVKDYTGAVQAFKTGQVKLAWFGGLSGVQARLGVPDSQAIAMGAEDAQFKTYFIAKKSLEIKASESFPLIMQGKTFCFGSKSSTSGRLMPEYFIRQHSKMAPDAFFSKVAFSGDHSKTVKLVNTGVYDFGAVNFKVWEKMKDQTPDCHVIWSTPDYVDYNWTVHAQVDEIYGAGFSKKLQDIILCLDPKNPLEKAILDDFQRSKFIKATNEIFAPIEETAKEVGIIRQ